MNEIAGAETVPPVTLGPSRRLVRELRSLHRTLNIERDIIRRRMLAGSDAWRESEEGERVANMITNMSMTQDAVMRILTLHGEGS